MRKYFVKVLATVSFLIATLVNDDFFRKAGASLQQLHGRVRHGGLARSESAA
jgi:hypothetical protein